MRLSDDAIRERLRSLDGWNYTEGKLEKHYRFSGFMDGVAFVNRVAEAAEAMNHHPDICLGYGYVTVSVWTHSEGGVTGKDFELARKCDEAAR